MSKWEDEDGVEGPWDRAMAKAEREDARSRAVAAGNRAAEGERRTRELADLDIEGSHSCAAGEMYVHHDGVPCPACGEVG